MRAHAVSVRREGRWWIADVPGVGATQARRLGELRDRAADLIATALDCDPEEVELEMDVELPADVVVELDRAAALREQSARAQREAALAVRSAAARLHEQGVSVRDIGTALGVSYQRAHQLLNGG